MPATDVLGAAPIGERAGEGEEHQIAAGHEGGRQAAVGHRDRGLARQRGVRDRAERVERQRHGPRPAARAQCGVKRREPLAHARAHGELDRMPLAVIEADRLDMREALAAPRRGRRWNPARRKTARAPCSLRRLIRRLGTSRCAQSHTGATAMLTTRCALLPARRVRSPSISASDNSKSKIAKFSFSRSTLLVRGIDDEALLHEEAQRDLRRALAMRACRWPRARRRRSACRARSGYKPPRQCRACCTPRSPCSDRDRDAARSGCRRAARSCASPPHRAARR